MRTIALPVHHGLADSSRLPVLAQPAGQLQLAEIAWLLGAGIAATFNAPIAGMFFAMEVILRDVSIRHLHTIAVASVAGAVVSHTLIGDELTFDVSPYSLDDPAQLVLYGVLGLIAVGLAIAFIEALDWFTILPDRMVQWARPLLMGLGVAAIGFVAPEVLGTGQKFIGTVLSQEISKAWWLFALLAIAKLIATSATLGGKGAGESSCRACLSAP